MEVENNTLMHVPLRFPTNSFSVYGVQSSFSWDWEILSKFLAIHNIEPKWLDCNFTFGWFDEDLGGWTGCMGKV